MQMHRLGDPGVTDLSSRYQSSQKRPVNYQSFFKIDLPVACPSHIAIITITLTLISRSIHKHTPRLLTASKIFDWLWEMDTPRYQIAFFIYQSNINTVLPIIVYIQSCLQFEIMFAYLKQAESRLILTCGPTKRDKYKITLEDPGRTGT